MILIINYYIITKLLLRKIVSYEYDFCGKLLSIKDNEDNIITDNNNIGIINPFRYRGYYYDEETSLYYLNSRYYNPVWCRFLNADGLIGANQDILSYNLYAYVSNSTVLLSDSSGAGFFDWVEQVHDGVKNFVNKVLDWFDLGIEVNSVSSSTTCKVDAYVAKVDGGVSSSKTIARVGNTDSKTKIKINFSESLFDSTIGFESNYYDNNFFSYEFNSFSTNVSFGEIYGNFSYSYDLGHDFGLYYLKGQFNETIGNSTKGGI